MLEHGTTRSESARLTSVIAEPGQWYVCYTRSRAEKRVERLLLERRIEAYLPTIELKRKWADRTRLVTFPLFPGYVFGRFTLHHLYRVLAIPGVSSVVRLGGRLAPIPDAEIENIRRLAAGLCGRDRQPELRPFQEGDTVRVSDGPFRGVEGVVIQVRGRAHVLVGLRAIGQCISLCIDEHLLEPIAVARESPRAPGLDSRRGLAAC